MVEAQQVHLGGGVGGSSTHVSPEATGTEIRCTGPGAPHDPQAAAASPHLPTAGRVQVSETRDRRWAPSPHFPGPACRGSSVAFAPPPRETEVFALGYGESALAGPFKVADRHTVTYGG